MLPHRDPEAWGPALDGRPAEPGATVGVLLEPADAETARARSADHLGGYAREVLAHAGLEHAILARSALVDGPLPPLVLLPYPLRLSPAELAALEHHVDGGGAVVACGGVEGGDRLFGIATSRRRLSSGSVLWPDGGLGLEGVTLPVWGAQLARLAETDPAEALGAVLDPSGAELGIAAAVRRRGRGVAVYLAADVLASVVRIQQGWPVLGDGTPAPDGSAPLDDRLLKCDDGAALGWSWRHEVAGQLAFTVPFADRLRELLLAAVLSCAEHQGRPLAMLWYWPRALPAVGHLSHDTDSNEDRDGRAFMGLLDSLGVPGTWCVMYPGGYRRELYDALRRGGHEVALHYDGLTTDLNGAAHCAWSEADFRHQHAWLLEETGVGRVLNQKNHVTRWEGWVECFRWVERAGIPVDSTKGPSKVGNLGFVFGSCHPWRPVDDLAHENRPLDLLELPFLAMDMWQTEQRRPLRRALLDAAARHHGVAHFLFHPQRLWEDGMRESIEDVVGYGRERGLEWWTSERILAWELARRAAGVRVRADGDGRAELELDGAPEGATVVLGGRGGTLRTAPPGARVGTLRYLSRTLTALTFDAPPARVALELDPAAARDGVPA